MITEEQNWSINVSHASLITPLLSQKNSQKGVFNLAENRHNFVTLTTSGHLLKAYETAFPTGSLVFTNSYENAYPSIE